MSYKDEIIRLRKEGNTYKMISEELGCSKGTVHYHCSKLEYDKEIANRNREKLKKVLPSFDNTKIIQYLVETGNSRKIIADALRMDYSDLILYCKRNKIKSDQSFKGYEKVKQHRRNKKILAALYLGGKCERCGYNKSYSALEFHHMNPNDKEFSIAKNTNLSWAKMKKEIDKCKLLCSNCHREHHDKWI